VIGTSSLTVAATYRPNTAQPARTDDPGDTVRRVGLGDLQKIVEAGVSCRVELLLSDADGVRNALQILQDARCAIRGLHLKVGPEVATDEGCPIRTELLSLCRSIPASVNELSLRNFGSVEFEAACLLPASVRQLDIQGPWEEPRQFEFLSSRVGLNQLEVGVQEGLDMREWAAAVVETAHPSSIESLILRKDGDDPIDPKGFAKEAVAMLLDKKARLAHLTLPQDCKSCLTHRVALETMNRNTGLQTIALGGALEPPEEAAAILQVNRMAQFRAMHGEAHVQWAAASTNALCAKWSSTAETNVLSPGTGGGLAVIDDFSMHMRAKFERAQASTNEERLKIALEVREEIDKCPNVSDQVRSKMRSLVSIEVERYRFAVTTCKHDNPYLRNIVSPELNAWRLVMDGHAQVNGTYFFERERGFMAGALRGLNFMVETLDAPMTVEHLIALHDTAVDGVFAPDADTPDKLLVKGLRRPTHFGTMGPLDFGEGGNATNEGVAELRANPSKNQPSGSELLLEVNGKLSPSSWVSFISIDDEPWIYVTVPADPALVKARIAEILDACRDELAKARDLASPSEREHAVLTSIATRCQDLAQYHFFEDGNLRTVMLVMNKLLMQSGMPPAIVWQPQEYAMCSISQIVDSIRQGQKTFAGLLSPH
jgi:hypothetical protein